VYNTEESSSYKVKGPQEKPRPNPYPDPDEEPPEPPAEWKVENYKGTAHKPTKANILDAELEELLSKQRATIKVVGAGGAGNNTINRITEIGISGAETIAINTDAQDLLYTTSEKRY